MSKIECAKKLILQALLAGQKITAYDANQIGRTTAGARRIRQIREKFPVKKEQVPGESYCRYYLDEDFLFEFWKSKSAQGI